jgi:anti-anti-sigma factor
MLLNGKGRYKPRHQTRHDHMNSDPNGFQIASEQNGEETVAKLAGSITIDSSPELRRVLLQTLKAPVCRRFTLDCSDLAYIDSAGLAVLLEALRSAKQLGKSLQLSGLRERPRYLLESTGLLRFFHEAATKQ